MRKTHSYFREPRKIQSISMQWIGRFGACLPTNFHHKTAGFLAKARWFCVRSETRKFSFRARLSINRSHFMRKLSIGVFAIAVLAASISCRCTKSRPHADGEAEVPAHSRPQAKVLLRQYHRILRPCRWRAEVPVRCRHLTQQRHPLNVRTLAADTTNNRSVRPVKSPVR